MTGVTQMLKQGVRYGLFFLQAPEARPVSGPGGPREAALQGYLAHIRVAVKGPPLCGELGGC